MGAHPGTRSGRPNPSEPAFRTPMASSLMMGVVGIPLFSLRMLAISHPFASAPPTPWRDFGPGISQMALIAALWVMLYSEGPLLMDGSNQHHVVLQVDRSASMLLPAAR